MELYAVKATTTALASRRKAFKADTLCFVVKVESSYYTRIRPGPGHIREIAHKSTKSTHVLQNTHACVYHRESWVAAESIGLSSRNRNVKFFMPIPNLLVFLWQFEKNIYY